MKIIKLLIILTLLFVPVSTLALTTITDTNITTTGIAGIGLTTPLSPLHVKGTVAWNTTSAQAGQDTIFVENLASGAGLGNFGASIGFAPHYTGTLRRAAIAAVQNGSDADQIGLAFFTHPSASAVDISEAMRLDHNGRLGIGTTAPARNLDISSNTNATLRLSSTDVTMIGEAYGVIEFKTDDSSRGPRVVSIIESVDPTASGGRADIVFRTWDSTNIKTRPPEMMRITGDGYVGIGTPAPTAALHIKRTGDAQITLEADSDNSGEEDNPRINLSQDGGGITAAFGIEGSAGATVTDSTVNMGYIGKVDTTSDSTFGIITKNIVRMYFNQNGNIGIGMEAPLAALQIAERDQGQLVFSTSAFVTSKFTSQGETWATAGADNGIVFNDAAATRPEISWIRGSRTYPEFSIRQHTTADAGGQFWSGSGQVAPTLTMSIASGNVGVGTITNPTEPLHIQKNQAAATSVLVQNTNTAGLARFTAQSDDANHAASFRVYGSTAAGNIGAGNGAVVPVASLVGIISQSTNSGLYVFQDSAKPLYFGNDFGFIKVHTDGKVGINITNPAALLHVDFGNSGSARADVGSVGTGFGDATSPYLNIRGGVDATGQDAVLWLRNEQTNLDWGIYLDSSDSDKLKIQRDGETPAITITSAGLIGMGLTPIVPLDLRNGGNDLARLVSTDDIGRIIIADDEISLYLGARGDTNSLWMGTDSTPSTGFALVLKTDTGHIGIGTGASVDERLHVQDAVNAGTVFGMKMENTGTGMNRFDFTSAASSRGLIGIEDTDGGALLTGTAGYEMVVRSEDELWFGTNGNNVAMVIDNSQDTEFKGVVQVPDGSASAPTYTFSSDTDTGMYRASIEAVGISTDGNATVYWNTNAQSSSTAPLGSSYTSYMRSPRGNGPLSADADNGVNFIIAAGAGGSTIISGDGGNGANLTLAAGAGGTGDANGVPGSILFHVPEGTEVGRWNTSGLSITDDMIIQGNITPALNNTYSLGTPKLVWKDVHVGPGSIHLGSITMTDNEGELRITSNINTTGNATFNDLNVRSENSITIGDLPNILTTLSSTEILFLNFTRKLFEIDTSTIVSDPRDGTALFLVQTLNDTNISVAAITASNNRFNSLAMFKFSENWLGLNESGMISNEGGDLIIANVLTPTPSVDLNYSNQVNRIRFVFHSDIPATPSLDITDIPDLIDVITIDDNSTDTPFQTRFFYDVNMTNSSSLYVEGNLTVDSNINLNKGNITNILKTVYNTTGCTDNDEGTFCYDADFDTMRFVTLSGQVLQMNQESTMPGKNIEGLTVVDGSIVYVTGAVGINPTFKLARADDLNTSGLLGVLTKDCVNNQVCPVVYFGLVNDVDTSTFSEGDHLYLSDTESGNLTTTPPDFPSNPIWVATAIRIHATEGSIFVFPRLDSANGITMNTLGLIGDFIQTDYKIRSLPGNAFINQNVFTIEMNGTTGQDIPHLVLQPGGAGQASIWVRSGIVAPEVPNCLNNTNRTDSRCYANEGGFNWNVDFNTSIADGADWGVTGDLDVVKNAYVGGNITLGQKITFALSETIENIIDGWIKLTGNVQVTENLNVTGNITGNHFYGEMWFEADGTITTSISGANVWTNITGFNQSDNNGFIRDGDSLITQVAGKYFSSYSISFTGQPNTEFNFAVSVDGVPQSNTESHRKIGASADVGNSNGKGKISVAVGDVITLQVSNIDNSNDAIIHHASLVLPIRVGD